MTLLELADELNIDFLRDYCISNAHRIIFNLMDTTSKYLNQPRMQQNCFGTRMEPEYHKLIQEGNKKVQELSKTIKTSKLQDETKINLYHQVVNILLGTIAGVQITEGANVYEQVKACFVRYLQQLPK